MDPLTSSHDPKVVIASLLIACFASYVALDLSRRVRTRDRGIALAWWAGGSLAMGSGIWAMHFVGMLGLSLPIALGYRSLPTLLSWLSGIAASAVALGVASRGALTRRRLAAGSLTMGAGIGTMHYAGMAALEMTPGIVWDATLVVLSVLVAVVASGAALLTFFWLRRQDERRRPVRQIAAALLMGLAAGGMHYTGMAAAAFPAGSVCLSADDLSGSSLTELVALTSLALLGLTLFSSTLDARMQARTARLAESLQRANGRLKSANEALRKQALLDALTGLPNRLLVEDRLRVALARQSRAADAGRRRPLALLFVDLDGFKPVNDSYGHQAGDAVLREAARRLRATACDTDTVARVGADEFLLLMEESSGPADAVALAQRLIAVIAAPFELPPHTLQISCSVGIVVHEPGADASRLLAHADAAMLAAKRAGGATCALFEARMDTDAHEQLGLQNDLRRALERRELLLNYQPKVDAASGRICGVEALLRWRHPARGMVSPAVFIPVAERFGLIGSLGAWVIDEACRQMQEWAEHGARIRVAINLSVHQLREAGLVEHIEAALRRHGLEASQLLCEITESVAMDDLDTTQRAFDGLARLGVFLAIDDFGTGYSSLACLRQLPAQQLKIDRSFVRDLESSDAARSVVDAVIHLSHRLGLEVVAEGVETAGQRDVLVELGCDQLQGYLYARPMPPGELLAWALGQRPAGAVEFSPSTVGELQGV